MNVDNSASKLKEFQALRLRRLSPFYNSWSPFFSACKPHINLTIIPKDMLFEALCKAFAIPKANVTVRIYDGKKEMTKSEISEAVTFSLETTEAKKRYRITCQAQNMIGKSEIQESFYTVPCELSAFLCPIYCFRFRIRTLHICFMTL